MAHESLRRPAQHAGLSACDRDAARRRVRLSNLAMPGFTAPKLLWVARHEPELFRRTACVLLPKDWLRLIEV
ncbi:FGGY family carbohydrate kinase, partial [Burkholderia sp. SIMBA_019]